MAKFKLEDPVRHRFGAGTISYVWPEEKLGRGEQTYFVDIPHKGTYDCRESELELIVASPIPTAPAVFPPPEPEPEAAQSDRPIPVEPRPPNSLAPPVEVRELEPAG